MVALSLRRSMYRALPRPLAKWKYAIWLVIVLAGLTLPSVFANTKAEQFWLPGTGDGSCHFQYVSMTLGQGHGVSGTIVSSNPIIVAILADGDKQSLHTDPSACDSILTLGLVNSGSTSNYDLQFTAPYSVGNGSPFWITFANVGDSDALITINLTTW